MNKLGFDAIGTYIHPTRYRQIVKRRASMSSLARSRGFCRKTKNTTLLLPKFTIKSNDPVKLLWRVTGAYKNFKVPRVQRWTRTSTQDSKIQFSTQNINSSPKKDALPKRILRSQRSIRHVLRFTKEEDDFLKEGLTKHGFGQWTAILRDDSFQFQDGTTADSPERAGMKMTPP